MFPAMEHSIALQESTKSKAHIVNLYPLVSHISATFDRKQRASYIFQFSLQIPINTCYF